MIGCGDDGSSITVDPDSWDRDKLVRACTVVKTCLGLEVNECLGYMITQGTPAKVDCVLEASLADCNAANACIGASRTTDPNCVPGCGDGDTLVQCDGTTRTEIECGSYIGSYGPSCVANATAAFCGVAACDPQAPFTCDGTKSLSCGSTGLGRTADCARRGEECVTTSPGCAGVSSGACTGAFLCDGDDVVTCDQGVERRTDCSVWAGGTCITVVNNLVGCGWGEQCDLNAGTFCVGTTLRSCVYGLVYDVACPSIGGTQCTELATGPQCTL